MTDPRSEREQTNESLRVERDRSDRALDHAATRDDEADAVIALARARADVLLAFARTKFDESSIDETPTDALETSRAAEDHIVERERVVADDDLERERVEHARLLSRERQTTDQDLSHERTRTDKASATREEYMGSISHDLLNLLHTMVGIAALIEDDVVQEHNVERVAMYARRVQQSGVRMRRLVEDLVDVASIEAGSLAVVPALGDPADVVIEAVDMFQAQASAENIALTAEIAPGLPSVPFDAARILQVLCNLLRNALKFTPSHGSVVVRLEHVDDAVLCCVSDTGPGIPDDKVEAVFERSVQLTKSDYRAVGLGLFISKCIVTGHGGQIWVESREGPGSTFRFTLPTAGRVH